MNAIGIGKFYSNQGANNAMDGLSCLSPSVSKNINFLILQHGINSKLPIFHLATV